MPSCSPFLKIKVKHNAILNIICVTDAPKIITQPLIYRLYSYIFININLLKIKMLKNALKFLNFHYFRAF